MKHKKNRRCTRVCECGATFHPTVKFGNEKKCDACYQRSKEEFLADFDRATPEKQAECIAFALGFLARLLAKAMQEEDEPEPINPEQVDADNQDAIDAEFTVIMADMDGAL